MASWNEDKTYSKNNRQDLQFDSILKAEQEAWGLCKDYERANRCQYPQPFTPELEEAYKVKCLADRNWDNYSGNATFDRGASIYPKK